MLKRFVPSHKVRRWLAWAALVMVVGCVSGCRTLNYYAQAAKGQLQILAREEAIQKILKKEDTAPELKAKLKLILRLREFADHQLKLPVDGHYRKYADLGRPYVVWNVEAAPAFSMEPKGWWYPFVGTLEYRGFFVERTARKYGDWLKSRDYDVQVGGVTAYSTLGWFRDPVLNTFLFAGDTELAETIFHELGHQRVFARGDKDFNEAFAMLVGREGVRRWLRGEGHNSSCAEYEVGTRREDEFADLVIKTRRKLEKVYGDRIDKDGKTRATKAKAEVPRDELAREKARVYEEMRQDYQVMRARWNGWSEYDNWFDRPLNNAKLNSVAAYHDLVPGFQRLLELNGNNLQRFYAAAERLSNMNREDRHKWLTTLRPAGEAGRAQ